MNEEILTVEKNAPEIPEEPEREVVFEEALEAILFAAGHPISYSTLARVFEMTPGRVKDLVFDYSIRYNNADIPRGVILLVYADSCQLCTKQNYLAEIREALGIRKSGTLSTSSLEVLAIVAYNQPVTRAFVDTLRRVDSSYAMNNLIDRGLIHSVGRLDVPGRPMLYGTTQDFLRSFGLSSLAELPSTTEELISAFESAKSETSDTTDSLQLTVDIDSAMPGAKSGIEDEAQEDISASAAVLDEPSAEDDISD